MAVVEMNWRPGRQDLRLFAVVLWIVAAGLAWVCDRRGNDLAAAAIVACSTVVLVAGMMRPPLLHWPFVLWMLLAFPLGWVMAHVLLGVVYFGVITPIALVSRLAGRDPLQLKPRRNADSYWINRPPAPKPSRYFRQF